MPFINGKKTTIHCHFTMEQFQEQYNHYNHKVDIITPKTRHT